MPLPACPSCSRHVKAHEPACPFCGNRLRERSSGFVLASGLAAVPLALAACQAPAIPSVGPPVGAVASTTPGPVPTASPSPAPSDRPATPSPTPLMRASEWASAPAPAYGKSTIISGEVYDETGTVVDGATVTVKSLDTSVPYTATAHTSQGSWVVNSIPEGANIAITASKDGWTSRQRLGVFQTNANVKNIVDFGGQTDAVGTAYFLSDYPEVASVAPADGANDVDGSALGYKLTLSEPLDKVNQARFASAVRLFPANGVAAPENDGSNGGAGFADLADQKIAATGASSRLDRPVDPDPDRGYSPAAAPNHPVAGMQPAAANPLPWDYSIKSGTRFLDDANTVAGVTWDATGTIATLNVPAPLVSDRVQQARYQVGLVAGGPGERIVDAHNHQLGMDVAGSQSGYPLAGSLLHATIKAPDLSSFQLGTATPATRWIATHQDAARFAVKAEADPPRLLFAAYAANVGASSRFELTFSQPLAAYNGRPGGHVGAAIRTSTVLDVLSLAASDRLGGTAGLDLKGAPVGLALDPNAGPFASFGQEFMLAGGSSAPEPYGEDIRVAEADAAKAGRYLLAVDPTDARRLFIYVIGRGNVFDQRVVELKVRAPDVPDQAGNMSQPADADRQQVTTSDLRR